MEKLLLKEMLSRPSAPYRESHVVHLINSVLHEENVPHFIDPVGNIVAGVGSEKEYKQLISKCSKEPVRLFMAHMDHPGFHGARWRNPNTLEVKWYGGSPRKYLTGAKVWLADSRGWVGEGVLTNARLNSSKSAIESGVVKIKKRVDREPTRKHVPQALYGGFAFRAPVWEKNNVIYTKAADDLVGSFAILSLAVSMAKKKKPFIGLFTRAEEVGFIGAIGHFELGWLESAKRKIVCISLETSRTLPGAIVGKGPVVRLGDKATPFDPGGIQILTGIAKKKLKGKYQRRIMDGGTCEATVATAYGYCALGISIPLGNYHNQSLEGGPDARGEWGPAPEFVHLQDIEGMLTLCKGLMESGLAWDAPWKSTVKEFLSWKKDAQTLLKLS